MPSEERKYSLRNLPLHLHASGHESRLEKVLTTYSFLRKKVEYLGPDTLLVDYDLLPEDSPLHQVQEVLRLSLQVLLRDPSQIDSQLLGRLLGRSGLPEAIARLLAEARLGESGTRLLPRIHSLPSAGGALVQTIAARGLRGKALAVTPDGQRVASGGLGHTVKVWEIESGRLLWSLTAHLAEVQTVAVTKGGRQAVSGSWDGMLAIWDLEDGRLERTLIGHGGAIESLAVTPDGRTAVTGMRDGAIEVWNLEAGWPVRELLGHSAPVLALVIDQAGRHAVSGSEDATVRCWNLATGAVRVLAGHGGPVFSLSMTRDGSLALSASRDRTIKLWDLPSGKEIETFRSSYPVLALALSADERYAVSGSFDGLRFWDLHARAEAFAIPTERCDAVAFLANEPRVLSSPPLRIWGLERVRPAPEPHAAIELLGAGQVGDGDLEPVQSVAHGLTLLWDRGPAPCRSAVREA
jgi:hypothetical protein